VTRALVSIGTNSTRLLVLDEAGSRVAVESRGTRLGAGIGPSGAIDAAAQERTLGAVEEYAGLARTHGATAIDAIATSALRRADDADAFGAEVAARLGVAPRVLSGDEEATYSFLGATATNAGTHQVAVLDVGGGSTEVAIDAPVRARESGKVALTMSLEIGAVRLSEKFPLLLGERALRPIELRSLEIDARSYALGILAPIAEVRGFDELIAVGGTVFTAAAMVAGGLRDGATMTRSDCASLIDALLALDVEGRKAMPHIRPQRADILPAGLMVVDEACRMLDVDHFTVSESDLLLGYLGSAAYRALPLPSKG
jgi:exopolyphosphatase/guanosine-5'-triphosphate,3'-diphosphate pyrophosphatase